MVLSRSGRVALVSVCLVACGPTVVVPSDQGGGGASSGGGAQPDGGAPSSSCPVAKPAVGDECAPAGLVCAYVDACGGAMECGNFGWGHQVDPCQCTTPACDPGDSTDGPCCLECACYQATAGDCSILCSDNLPQHGCPAQQPPEGTPCTELGMACDYPTNGDCFTSMLCDPDFAEWITIGGGCGL